MERIGEDVRRELGRWGPSAGIAPVVEAWPAAVGDAIARNAWPARLARDGTLHVATSSSAWAFELAQLSTELQARLAAAVGEAAPAKLRFAPGPLPERAVEHAEAGSRPQVVPTHAEEAEGAALAAHIADENLRKTVAKAAALSLARAASDRRF